MCCCNEIANPGRWATAGVEPSLDEMLNDPIVQMVLDVATLPPLLRPRQPTESRLPALV